MQYNYIIIEDNPGAMNNLLIALKPFEDLNCLGTANSLKEGVAKALSLRPHFIFLDVELGEESGFELMKEIRQFTSELPLFIMTTDFEQYAKEAVNKEVLYFLDKPIDPDELVVALSKVKKRMSNLQNQITIKNTEGHYFLDLKSIQYIEARNSSSIIYREGAMLMLVTKNLSSLECILPENFVRIHRSFIINKSYAVMINTTNKIIRMNVSTESTGGGLLELKIGDSFLEKVKQALLTS